MVLQRTVLCPTTQKTLKGFFVVYSPKEFDNDVHRRFISDHLDCSPHSLSTVEWGVDGNHKHANYFFYSNKRDANAFSRAYKLK